MHALARRGITAGEFIDVGAFDGVTYSNTRALAEAGWSGIFVEPNPMAASKLLRLYGGDHRHLIFLSAMGEEASMRPMALSDHDVEGLSTFDDGYMEKWRHVANFRRAVVPVMTWRNMLEMVCPDPERPKFEFVSIDTEGLSLALLRLMPEALRPAVICVEKDSEDLRTKTILELDRRGYMLIYESLENIVGEMRP